MAVQKLAFGRQFLRVVNYHCTPAGAACNFERQLRFFRSHFVPAAPDDLDECIAGRWNAPKPGIVLTFDDGYRSNYDIAAPLLEKNGFRGVFFIPSAEVALTRGAADINFRSAGPDQPEPRLSWPECRDLAARGHTIGSHTRTHLRLSDDQSTESLNKEIAQSRVEIRRILGIDVRDFCWVGGEEWAYGKIAYQEVVRAGYTRAYMTNLFPVLPGSSPFWIQRTNIEADWPVAQAKLYLSGIMDIAYWPKRRRLHRKLMPSNR